MLVLGDVVKLNAKRYANKKALMMDNQSLTFDEFNKLVNRIAHGLRSIGLRQCDRVAIWSHNCIEYMPIVFAVWKCGCVIIPLNFRFKADEAAYVLNNCQPKIVFHEEALGSLAEETFKRCSAPIVPISISGKQLKGGTSLQEMSEDKSDEELDFEPDTLSQAMIMYTSGTTGNPKGVTFTHFRELSDITNHSMEMGLTSDDIMLANLPMFHNSGLSATVMIALLHGCTCVILGGSFDADVFFSTIEKYKITVANVVPTILAKLVGLPQIENYNLSSLKKMFYGSSPISETVLDAALKTFKVDFYQLFAQTETGMLMVLKPADHYTERSRYTGCAMCRSDVRVVDENGHDTPIGEVGEIISRQKPLGMDGYYDMEEATRETIRDGWIYTGDLARVEPDGYFTVVDRLKDMIISGAENIYCKEIENVISEHPGVEEVVVFGIPDEMWGESVCAVVVPKADSTVNEKDIIDFCASRLSGYKRPKRVELRKELPRNAAGKPMKKVLREPYWEGRSKRV
jgi:acyl-CoA synthetase (AMP-forming)/AMP-acid ligase II